MPKPAKLEGWAALDPQAPDPDQQKKIDAAIEDDRQFNISLAKTFGTGHGKKVLAKWKEKTIERRISLTITSPVNGQVYGKPEVAVYAAVAEENFVKDILTRIERAKEGPPQTK